MFVSPYSGIIEGKKACLHDNTDNSARGCATSCLHIRKADEKPNVEHSRGLDGGTDDEGKTSAYAINNDGDVDDSSGQLDNSIYTSGEQRTGALGYANHGEDLRSEIVERVGTGQFVEEEQHNGEEEPATVASVRSDILHDNEIVGS